MERVYSQTNVCILYCYNRRKISIFTNRLLVFISLESKTKIIFLNSQSTIDGTFSNGKIKISTTCLAQKIDCRKKNIAL